MSYDLAVWVGQRPDSDEAAADEYERRADASEADESAPGAAVTAFVAGLLERWPEGRDDDVWAMEPVLEDQGGDFLCLTMTVSDHLDDIVERAAELAETHGLVLYDPQRECLVEHTSVGSTDEPIRRPRVSMAHDPFDLDRATAADVLGIDGARLDRLIREVAAGPRLDIPRLITLLLVHDHEDLSLPPEMWRRLVPALERWWSDRPDVNDGCDWLSTNGQEWLILSEPDEPGPGWRGICSWDVTSCAAMLLWTIGRAQPPLGSR